MDTYDTQTVGHGEADGRRRGDEESTEGGGPRGVTPGHDSTMPAPRGRFGLRPGATKRNALFALLYLVLALVSLGVIRLLF